MDQNPMTDEISSDFTHQAQEPFLSNPIPHWITNLSLLPEEHNTGSHGVDALHCHDDSDGVLTEDDHHGLGNDCLSDFSNCDFSLPEVCIVSNTKHIEEEMNYEVQQAYRIFNEFLTDKHKVITSLFLQPIRNQETQYGIGGVCSKSQANVKQSICLCRMEEKFINKEYETITEFVADFRLMLENCYRYHGVDHWLSKQAQKLEIMLEQKLTLLSRKLREKTTLAVTSKGRFAVGEECISTSSTRRRQTSRCLKTLTVGESIMVQTLRMEEQHKAKEEKRRRELEKKEAEEMSAKEAEEWEKNLLSQASPHNVETLWELPAIGHFLCLAQTALNLPEIVYFELERCLLMPRCSFLLSKIMSSLLSPPQRRSTLHRRPVMPYKRWESELRQWVKFWYQSVGASIDQASQAEQLGLCHQFFSVLGEISPLEAKAFHMLPFYQRVWLLKGLCDHVYETQRDIQNAVLAQPIHECRESILGYDSKENAYIHFPHFCGADLRIYCQSPCTPPSISLASVLVKKVEQFHKLEDTVSKTTDVSGASFDDKSQKTKKYIKSKIETIDGEEVFGRYHSCESRKQIPLKSNDEVYRDESKVDLFTNSSQISTPFRKRILITPMEGETTELKSKRLKEETDNLLHLKDESEIQEHCPSIGSIGEHCYTGRSPTGSVTFSTLQKIWSTNPSTTQKDQNASYGQNIISSVKLKQFQCCPGSLELSQLPSKLSHSACEERVKDKTLTMNKGQGKKKGKKLLWIKHKHNRLRKRPSQPEAPKPVSNRFIAIKRKDEKKQHIPGQALNYLKNKEDQLEPSFKLVCTNLDDLRELINKTEDELDDLESAKKKINQRYYRREAVKDLHSTLIRLLNELLPWEPKLIKAYQRNRLRLKKEFDVFRNHPVYCNFVREESISSSNDGELGLLLEQLRQSGHEDPEHIFPRGLGETVKDLSTELATVRPVTHISYNQHKPLSATDYNLGHSDTSKITCEFERSCQSVKAGHSNSSLTANIQLNTVPISEPSSLHTASGKPKNYTPIPTLLVKNVGNKVTLMKQPAHSLEIDNLNLERKRTVVSIESTDRLKVNDSSSGPPKNSQQNLKNNSEQSPKRPVMDGVALPLPVVSISKTAKSLKESTQVFYTGHTSQNPSVSSSERCEEIRPQQVIILPSDIILNKNDGHLFLQSKDVLNSKIDTMLGTSTNLSVFSIPENKIHVQQVPPSKNIGLTDTSSSLSDIPSFPKSQQSAINAARSNGTQHCDVQTRTSQCTPNYSAITSTPLSHLLSTDSKQELKTVCIRESQSILVTTRGGNTGIVKVQKSSDHPCLSKSPVFTVSPQFQAYVVPKTSPLLSSDSTLAVTASSVQSRIQSLKSNTKVTTCAKTTSISFSQDMSQSLSPTKCQAFTALSGYTSTNPSKSCPPALVKKFAQSFSNLNTSPRLTALDIVSKPCADKTNEDNRSQSEKLVWISPSSYDVSVRCTKTLPTAKVTSVQVPCLIATTIAQNTAVQIQSSKCREADQMMPITAQPAFTNSSVISRGFTVPPSSLNSLKHLNISSVSKISQPGKPCTHPLSAASFKKKHSLSTIMISSKSNVYPPQSFSNPLSTPSTQSEPLNSLFISNASASFDTTSLPPSLAFTKSQVSNAVPKSTEITEGHKGLLAQTPTNTSTTGTAQEQILISTSMPLPGGAHIVLNNAHFMVPPNELGPGSHVLTIASNVPEQLPATSVREVTVPFLDVNQATVLQSVTRLPSVPAVRSSFVACTPIVAPSLQTTAVHGSNSTSLINKTVEGCPSLQSANIESTTEGLHNLHPSNNRQC